MEWLLLQFPTSKENKGAGEGRSNSKKRKAETSFWVHCASETGGGEVSISVGEGSHSLTSLTIEAGNCKEEARLANIRADTLRRAGVEGDLKGKAVLEENLVLARQKTERSEEISAYVEDLGTTFPYDASSHAHNRAPSWGDWGPPAQEVRERQRRTEELRL